MPPTNSTRNWVHSDRQPSFSKQTALLLPAVNQRQYRVCRKRLSLTDHLVVYDGDGTASRPLLSVRHHPSLRSSSKTLAHVTSLGSAAAEYVVEGSYGRRACAVRDARGGGAAVVAEVRRKESVGDDVFRLVADPRLGAPLAMGLVIALDEMFGAGNGSARSLLPRTWSV